MLRDFDSIRLRSLYSNLKNRSNIQNYLSTMNKIPVVQNYSLAKLIRFTFFKNFPGMYILICTKFGIQGNWIATRDVDRIAQGSWGVRMKEDGFQGEIEDIRDTKHNEIM